MGAGQLRVTANSISSANVVIFIDLDGGPINTSFGSFSVSLVDITGSLI